MFLFQPLTSLSYVVMIVSSRLLALLELISSIFLASLSFLKLKKRCSSTYSPLLIMISILTINLKVSATLSFDT